MKIVFYPITNDDYNSYLGIIKKAIKMSDPLIEFVKIPGFFNFYRWKKIKIFWLNWFENLDNRNLFRLFKGLINKLLIILYCKLFGIKLMMVFHNGMPHDPKYNIEKIFYRFLLKVSNKILILSNISKNVIKRDFGRGLLKKIILIPHPCYTLDEKKYLQSPHRFTVLFMGLIRPYKNLEMIIDLASKYRDISFIIAGKPLSEKYLADILNEIKQLDNVELYAKYLSDEEMDNFINLADIMILPYNTATSINSGVAMYALSKGINIIIPFIGTIEMLKNKDKVYHYSYDSGEDHMVKLEEVLLKSRYDFSNDYNKFISNSQQLRSEVIHSFSVEKISDFIDKSGILKLKNKTDKK
ncbi:MAG: glycosyltransferase [Muribaculaceae bacterium]|nr:glycosyltransferase [Muribaculaceae bacterium]